MSKNLFAQFPKYAEYAERGLINIVEHPENPNVVILNYTPQCVFERKWDEITRACRGLIVNKKTGEILARPFDKFFNYEEPEAIIPPGTPEVTVKLDGSLGISYRLNGKLYWATRGSFTSEQSQVAQEMWDRKYRNVKVPENLTILVEIIHPVTRVVVKYDFEDLVLIGARDRFTGYDYPYDELVDLARVLGMPVMERVNFNDLAEVRDYVSKLDDQHEGFVLRWKDGYRVKMKSPQYLEVFRIVRGLSSQKKAEAWANGEIDSLILALPEEFRNEIEQLKKELDFRLEQELNCLKEYMEQAPMNGSRKEFALWVQENIPTRYIPLAFGYYDNRIEKPLLGLRKRIADEFKEKQNPLFYGR